MDRAELEARAERALRRGEMSEALALYEELAAEFPDEGRFNDRIAHLRAALQPAELAQGGAPPPPSGVTELRPSTPEQEGERLFVIGDYAGAAAAYRRAVEERPDSELLRERLEELYRLARMAPRHSPTDSALPTDRQALLRALLDRISSRRRMLTRSAP